MIDSKTLKSHIGSLNKTVIAIFGGMGRGVSRKADRLSSSLVWQIRLFVILVCMAVVALTMTGLSDVKTKIQPASIGGCENKTTEEIVRKEASKHQSPAMAKQLKYTIIAMMTGILGLIIGVGFFIELKVVRPLDRMARFTDGLAKGCLNQTIKSGRGDEIGRIGQGLNEVAANIQELLLYSWNQAGNGRQYLENAKQSYKKETDNVSFRQNLKHAGHCMENIRLMAESFDLFEVSLSQGILEANVDEAKGNISQPPRNKGENHV
jgi:methyl-accepting chemotaxis protein